MRRGHSQANNANMGYGLACFCSVQNHSGDFLIYPQLKSDEEFQVSEIVAFSDA